MPFGKENSLLGRKISLSSYILHSSTFFTLSTCGHCFNKTWRGVGSNDSHICTMNPILSPLPTPSGGPHWSSLTGKPQALNSSVAEKTTSSLLKPALSVSQAWAEGGARSGDPGRGATLDRWVGGEPHSERSPPAGCTPPGTTRLDWAPAFPCVSKPSWETGPHLSPAL